MHIEFTPYLRSAFSHQNIRMVGSFLSQNKKIAVIVAATLTSFAAYYFINRRLSDRIIHNQTPSVDAAKDPGIVAARDSAQNSEADSAFQSSEEPDEEDGLSESLSGSFTDSNIDKDQVPPQAPAQKQELDVQFSEKSRESSSDTDSDDEYYSYEVNSDDSYELGEAVDESSSSSVQPLPLDNECKEIIRYQEQKSGELVVRDQNPPPAPAPKSVMQIAKVVARTAVQTLNEGIDFTPYLLHAVQAGVEFWNTPSQPYDPFTSNFMVGFARKFGKNLHFLLHNTTKFHGPELAGHLAEKLMLVDRAGKYVGNKAIKNYCNPFEWGSLIQNILDWVTEGSKLANLTDLGVNFIGFFSNGILDQLNKLIEIKMHDYVKKLNVYTDLDLEYFEKQEKKTKAEAKFQQEIQVYKDWLIANFDMGNKIREKRRNEFLNCLNWLDWHLDCLELPGYRPAYSYWEAKSAQDS